MFCFNFFTPAEHQLINVARLDITQGGVDTSNPGTLGQFFRTAGEQINWLDFGLVMQISLPFILRLVDTSGRYGECGRAISVVVF